MYRRCIPAAEMAMVLPLLYWLLEMPGVLPQPGLGATSPPLKVAVTACAAVRVTMQVPLPTHAPLQEVNEAPAAGVAVRVTAVPLA